MSSSTSPQGKNTTVVVALPMKSVGVSLLLSFLFGPLGLLYSSVIGGIVMLLVSIPLVIITMGLGVFLVVPICMIWGAVAVGSHNKKLLNKMGSQVN